MSELTQSKCLPCAKAGLPLQGEMLRQWMQRLSQGWSLVGETQIEKEFSFKNFREAMDFVNEIAKIAEEEGHHPKMIVQWGKVALLFTTHALQGLSENDFIMAAKSDACYAVRKGCK